MTSFFFFNDTATTEIYTLSLHDALPISLDSAETGDDRLREPVREVGARGVRGLEVQDGNARGLRHGLRHNGDAAGAAEPRVGEPRPPVRKDGAVCGGRIRRRRVEGSPLDDVTGLAPRVGGGGGRPFPRAEIGRAHG